MFGLPTRRLLTDDAIPTIFSFTKQAIKRKGAQRREANSNKRHLIETAIENNEELEQIDRENLYLQNTKACQTGTEMISVSTQTLGDFQNVQTQTDLFEIESHTSHSDTHSQIDIDTSFCFEEDLSTEDEEERDDDNERPNGSAFIVYWSCMLMLLNRCLNCVAPAFIKKVINKRSAICVHLICQNGQDVIWQSQPMVNRYHLGNLRRSASVLFSSNTYQVFPSSRYSMDF